MACFTDVSASNKFLRTGCARGVPSGLEEVLGVVCYFSVEIGVLCG